MPPVPVIILLVCAFAVGLYWPWNRSRIKNPRRHHAADDEYTVIHLDSEAHAFTDEQIIVARDRAKRLKIT